MEPKGQLREHHDGALGPMVSSPAGLLIPAAPLEAPSTAADDPLFRRVTTVLGYAELGDRPSTLPSVVDLLRQYSLELIVSVLARASALVHDARPGRESAQTQAHLITRLFPTRGDRIRAAIDRELEMRPAREVVLFNERQLLTLAKVAFLHLPVTEAHPAEPPLDDLGDALLMVSTLLDQGVGEGPTEDERRRNMELYVFANLLFNLRPDIVHGLARGFDFYLQRNPRVWREGDPDLSAMIEHDTGLAPDALWSYLFMLLGAYLTMTRKGVDGGRHVLIPEHWLSTLTNASAEERRMAFAAATVPAAELKQRVIDAYGADLKFYDIVAFAPNPMVSFGERVYCLSLLRLQQLAGPGLQYRFLDRRLYSRQETERFINYRARVVHDHVEQLLRRFYGDRHLPEAAILARAHGRQSCDNIVHYGHAVLLIECKAPIVLHGACTGAEWDDYMKVLQRGFLDAADQLHSTIQLIKDGAFVDQGFDPNIITRYYPLVVTYEVPMSSMMYRRLQTEGLATHALSAATQVAPLQGMDMDEFELLEVIAGLGLNLLDMLEAKVADPSLRELPFNHYWDDLGLPIWNRHNPHLEQRYHELVATATAFFRSRGMPFREAPTS
jgi:hypothetical protein